MSKSWRELTVPFESSADSRPATCRIVIPAMEISFCFASNANCTDDEIGLSKSLVLSTLLKSDFNARTSRESCNPFIWEIFKLPSIIISCFESKLSWRPFIWEITSPPSLMSGCLASNCSWIFELMPTSDNNWSEPIWLTPPSRESTPFAIILPFEIKVENLPNAGLFWPMIVLSITPPETVRASSINWFPIISALQVPDSNTPTLIMSWLLFVVIIVPLTSGIIMVRSSVGSSTEKVIWFKSSLLPSNTNGESPVSIPIVSAKIPVNPEPSPINFPENRFE